MKPKLKPFEFKSGKGRQQSDLAFVFFARHVEMRSSPRKDGKYTKPIGIVSHGAALGMRAMKQEIERLEAELAEAQSRIP